VVVNLYATFCNEVDIEVNIPKDRNLRDALSHQDLAHMDQSLQ
jgi:hypothetical protein